MPKKNRIKQTATNKDIKKISFCIFFFIITYTANLRINQTLGWGMIVEIKVDLKTLQFSFDSAAELKLGILFMTASPQY